MTENTEIEPGEATIYFAMPTAPDDANAASLLEHVELLRGAQGECARLEVEGWVPRWCDNPGDNEFFEFAYEKTFPTPEDAIAEVDRFGLGLSIVWDGEPIT